MLVTQVRVFSRNRCVTKLKGTCGGSAVGIGISEIVLRVSPKDSLPCKFHRENGLLRDRIQPREN